MLHLWKGSRRKNSLSLQYSVRLVLTEKETSSFKQNDVFGNVILNSKVIVSTATRLCIQNFKDYFSRIFLIVSFTYKMKLFYPILYLLISINKSNCLMHCFLSSLPIHSMNIIKYYRFLKCVFILMLSNQIKRDSRNLATNLHYLHIT